MPRTVHIPYMEPQWDASEFLILAVLVALHGYCLTCVKMALVDFCEKPKLENFSSQAIQGNLLIPLVGGRLTSERVA